MYKVYLVDYALFHYIGGHSKIIMKFTYKRGSPRMAFKTLNEQTTD